MPLPALWSDSFTPAMSRQAWVEPFPVGWNGEGAASTSISAKIEERLGRMTHVDTQLSTFTGWRYVYISRIMEMIGRSTPTLVREKRGTASRAAQAARDPRELKNRQYLRQFYGILQSGADEYQVIPSHPVLTLLKKPNRDDTWSSFIAEVSMYDELTGEFFIWVGNRNQLGHPLEIFAFARNGMRPKLDPAGNLIGFELIRGGATVQAVPVEDVAWYRRKSPFGKLEAMSPTAGGGRWIMSEALIELSRATRFSNGGAPDVFLELDLKAFPTEPSDTQLSRMSEKLQRRFGLRNVMGGIIPLAPGVKANQVGHSPREMDFGQSSKEVRDNLGSLHGVSKFIVGQTDDMNHNQTVEAHRGFYSFKLNPALARYAEVLTHFLLPQYDPTAIERGALIYFPDQSPESPEEERKEVELDLKCRAITPNERRLQRGRKPKPGAAYETCYGESSAIPLDLEAQDELLPDAPEPVDDAGAPDDAEESDDAEDSAGDGAGDGEEK